MTATQEILRKPRSSKGKAKPNPFNRGRGSDFVWDVFAGDGWLEKWGEPPHLGTVKADSEFDAVRAAYDKKLLPYNFTFDPKVVRRG